MFAVGNQSDERQRASATAAAADSEIDTNQLIAVDQHDTPIVPIAQVEKYQAHRHPAQRHRAISVWLYNSAGQLLLQKRSQHKIVGAGWWGNTVCGNVAWGESYQQCAIRRLREELGIVCNESELELVRTFEYKAWCNDEYAEHEIDHMFVVRGKDCEPQPNPLEVSEYQWVDGVVFEQAVATQAKAAKYYTAQQTLKASWDELAQNMRPLVVFFTNIEGLSERIKLAPWTVLMAQDGCIYTP